MSAQSQRDSVGLLANQQKKYYRRELTAEEMLEIQAQRDAAAAALAEKRAEERIVTVKGRAGVFEVIENTGVFRPYGSNEVWTQSGRKFANAYEFRKELRAEKIKQAVKMARYRCVSRPRNITEADSHFVQEYLAKQDAVEAAKI